MTADARQPKSTPAVARAVRVETGEEMDKDLWMLVEELRDQNRHLIEEMTAAKSKGTLSGAAADQYASSAPGHHCLAAARPASSANGCTQ